VRLGPDDDDDDDDDDEDDDGGDRLYQWDGNGNYVTRIAPPKPSCIVIIFHLPFYNCSAPTNAPTTT
jgi:hypothetical protein